MKTTTCCNKTYEIRSDEAFRKTNAYMLLVEFYKQIYMADDDPLVAEFASDDERTRVLFVYFNGKYECYVLSTDDWQRQKVCVIGAGCDDDEYDALFIEDIQPESKDWLNTPTVKKEHSNLSRLFDLCVEC